MVDRRNSKTPPSLSVSAEARRRLEDEVSMFTLMSQHARESALMSKPTARRYISDDRLKSCTLSSSSVSAEARRRLENEVKLFTIMSRARNKSAVTPVTTAKHLNFQRNLIPGSIIARRHSNNIGSTDDGPPSVIDMLVCCRQWVGSKSISSRGFWDEDMSSLGNVSHASSLSKVSPQLYNLDTTLGGGESIKKD